MPTLIPAARRMLLLSSAALLSLALLSGIPGDAAISVRADPHAPVLATALPSRLTRTPWALTPTASLSPAIGSVPACITVFPIERVEELLTIPMSIPQLEAAFGRAAVIGGRPTRLRIEARGCTLLITPGPEGVQEAELVDYGALNWLLARYGDPAGVGVSQGNLVLPMTGYTALLYPDQGIIALFAVEPEELTPDMPANSLFFRPRYALNAQARRLNLRWVEADVSQTRFPIQ